MPRPDFKQKLQKTTQKFVKWEPRDLALTSKYLNRTLNSSAPSSSLLSQIPYPWSGVAGLGDKGSLNVTDFLEVFDSPTGINLDKACVINLIVNCVTLYM
jgi:hypothetical protein